MSGALPLANLISQSSQTSVEFRVKESKYGNGYRQVAPDGINNKEAAWSLAWQSLSTTDLTTLVSAFDAAAGADYFDWQAPGSVVTDKWQVVSYTITPRSGDRYSVSASLKLWYRL